DEICFDVAGMQESGSALTTEYHDTFHDERIVVLNLAFDLFIVLLQVGVEKHRSPCQLSRTAVLQQYGFVNIGCDLAVVTMADAEIYEWVNLRGRSRATCQQDAAEEKYMRTFNNGRHKVSIKIGLSTRSFRRIRIRS